MICDGKKQKGSVLVADGDRHFGNQLLAMIDGMGYDVVVARNGEKALDLFLKGSFDIVFTALKMPGMDGLTLSLQVKATSLNTPVVLILDDHLENIMNRIKAGQIDCVMSKPLSFGEIQKTAQYFETNSSRVQGSAQSPALKASSLSEKKLHWNLKKFKCGNVSDFACGSGFQPR
jgi:DNA-binding NtrC family response regulator